MTKCKVILWNLVDTRELEIKTEFNILLFIAINQEINGF